MAINKVIYNNATLLDLTNDTVTSDTLLKGATAHRKDGTTITGIVEFSKVYIGLNEPASSLGEDGDFYIKG